MQAFEESATGAGTTVIKVRIPSQGRALGKVAQGGVAEERIKVAAGRSSCRQSTGEGKVSAGAS
jgi:hypothetical protein